MTPYYDQRLARCGYNKKLSYKNIGKNQKRNIIWFNPPYSKSLKTNIDEYL